MKKKCKMFFWIKMCNNFIILESLFTSSFHYLNNKIGFFWCLVKLKWCIMIGGHLLVTTENIIYRFSPLEQVPLNQMGTVQECNSWSSIEMSPSREPIVRLYFFIPLFQTVGSLSCIGFLFKVSWYPTVSLFVQNLSSLQVERNGWEPKVSPENSALAQ